MKSIYFIAAVTVASLFISGCGDDRSGGEYHKSKSGPKKGWIYDSYMGKKMVEKNFVYIPGGFDVDGDGINESGFWLSKFEAKESNATDRNIDTSNVTDVQEFISKNFKVYSSTSKYFDKILPLNSGYTNSPASTIDTLKATKVMFTEGGKTVNQVSPLEAAISLKYSQIVGGYDISLPSEKEWMQVVKLVINNKENWISKEVGKGQLYQGLRSGTPNRRTFVIENNILGDDDNVPKDYKVEVYDLSGGVAEWTSGMVHINDRFLTGDSGKKEFNEINSIPNWWKPILKSQTTSLGQMEGAGQYHDGSALAGANDTLAVSSDGLKGDVDNYAVVARGGSSSLDDKTLVGIGAAKLNYGVGYQGPTVGFRAASDYVY
jgi:hypothetical protein